MSETAVDTKSLTAGMNLLQQTQIPFAASKAVNAVVLDIQAAERARFASLFTLRRKDWADRSVKITHFATKAEPFARLAIDPPGGGKGDLFGKFEDQTTKAARGAHGIALPVAVRRTKADIIRDNQRPKNFHLRRQGGRIVGDQGTYIVKLADGRELLLQRADLGKRAAKKAGRGSSERATLLYIFTPRPVELRHPLEFVATAELIVDRMWMRRFDEALTLALGTAR